MTKWVSKGAAFMTLLYVRCYLLQRSVQRKLLTVPYEPASPQIIPWNTFFFGGGCFKYLFSLPYRHPVTNRRFRQQFSLFSKKNDAYSLLIFKIKHDGVKLK